MQIKAKIIMICIFLGIIPVAVIFLSISKNVYLGYMKQKAVDKKAAELLSPGYKQQTVLRIINGEPNEILNLCVQYEDKSFEVNEIKPGFMYRHKPITTSYPVIIEYTYTINGHVYHIKRESFQSAGEVAIVLKKDYIDSWVIGPSDPNDVYGISETKAVYYLFQQE